MKVSIIIVHYHVKSQLFLCLNSIYASNPKIRYEVIVVDNDEICSIDREIAKKFPSVKYVKNKSNTGYSGGNNIGANIARGQYLFFLNPDTLVEGSAIDTLIEFIEKNRSVGIVAPLLLDKKRKKYPLQGASHLGLIEGIVAHSFLNVIFPKNPVSAKYWLLEWDKKHVKEVDTVPGTAFVIRKEIFDKIGGFDDRFFLFFEEHDICLRVKHLGYKIYMNPNAQIVHLWGESTKRRSDIKEIYEKSRFLYFRKHFGLASAFVVTRFLQFDRNTLTLIFILLLSLTLRFYKLSDLMMFIGDFGWFYLSARDMLLTGGIPLVGITSSHTWLHQGPLWTYITALFLWVFKFNPAGPAYFTALLGVITVYLIYRVGKQVFSERIGIIAAIFYATSPLVVVHARLPYHTSPIPILSLLFFYFLFRWVKGNISYFPAAVLSLTLLYNFELATVSLWFVAILVFIFGSYKKKKWATKIFSRKIVTYSFLAFFIPMFPILLYDIQNGFPQTIIFGGWLVYKTVSIVLPISESMSTESFSDILRFMFAYNTRLLFLPSGAVASLLLIISGVFVSRKYLLLFIWLFIPLVIFFLNKTSSEAYLPIFFPSIIMFVAVFFDIFLNKKYTKFPALTFVILAVAINTYELFSKDFLMGNYGYGSTLSQRITVAREIIEKSDGKPYQLLGRGDGSEFRSFTMNYEYLTWFLGHPPSKKQEKLVFIVSEENSTIRLEEFSK